MIKISVCIPAYKNAAFLRRCLQSLADQDFKDFEVVLSDDSPDDSVMQIAEEYQSRLLLKYYRNQPAKGTPANWNFAMQQAAGEYVKLMHDDDWLAEPSALAQYAKALDENPGSNFCFSAFNNVRLQDGNSQAVHCSASELALIKKDPYNLFKSNVIGPPSAVLVRRKGDIFYDENLKWLVDFEGYIRFLNHNASIIYLDQCLVNIGLGEEQVTASTKNNKMVVIPESLYFLEKHGSRMLKNIWVYDYYWRMFRNLDVKTVEAIRACGWKGDIPRVIVNMLHWQKRFPKAVLQFGPASKMLMTARWLSV